MFRSSSKESELANEPVRAEWVQYPGAGPTVNLSLGPPGIASFSGEFTDEDMSSAVRWGNLRVREEYRGGGIATRLVSALAHVAVQHSTAIMYGSVESQYVLRIFRRIMGDQAIQYMSGYPVAGEPPATTDVAIEALARTEADQPDLDWREGITVHVNLTGLAIVTLEQPIELNESLM